MIFRRALPARRPNETMNFDFGGVQYVATLGYFPDGTLGEIFLNTGTKLNSTADINVQDAAVAVSIALQYGCPVNTLRHAMKRNDDGSPQGALGAALDLIGSDAQPQEKDNEL